MGWEMKDIKKNWYTLINLATYVAFILSVLWKCQMPDLEFKCILINVKKD